MTGDSASAVTVKTPVGEISLETILGFIPSDKIPEFIGTVKEFMNHWDNELLREALEQ